MFHFESLSYFLLLIGLLPLGWLFSDFLRWRSQGLAQLGDPRLISQLSNFVSSRTLSFSGYRLVSVACLSVFALANPQFGSSSQTTKKQGVDLIICLDISQSMWAIDVVPNRMNKAKRLIQRIVDKMKGDRVGLVVFAGDAFLELPLTNDYAAAKLFLKSISPEITSAQGTAIDKALEMAKYTFDKQPGKAKAVLVISDGEDHEGEPEKEAKKLLDAGVRTYTVGVGTTKGANIPLEQNGEPKGMMVDREGKLVVTKLNEEILSELAVAGNGTYLHLDNEIVDAKTILANVAQVGQNNYGDVQTQHYASHFMEFMVIAFILLVWDSFFHLGKPRKQ